MPASGALIACDMFGASIEPTVAVIVTELPCLISLDQHATTPASCSPCLDLTSNDSTQGLMRGAIASLGGSAFATDTDRTALACRMLAGTPGADDKGPGGHGSIPLLGPRPVAVTAKVGQALRGYRGYPVDQTLHQSMPRLFHRRGWRDLVDDHEMDPLPP